MRLLTFAAAVALAAAAPHAGRAAGGVPDPADAATVVHVLNRLAFGPRPGDVERVQREGLARWIDSQLRPSTIADAALEPRLAAFDTLGLSSRTILRDYYQPLIEERRERQRQAGREDPAPRPADGTPGTIDDPAEPRPMPSDARRRARGVVTDLTQAKLLRAIYSERQLQEVLTDFWFNHFNVFAGKALTVAFVTEYEREAIRPHVLGKFRDLLGATAKSPAMLFYLDNARSADPKMAERVDRGLERLERGRRRGRAGRGADMSDEQMAQLGQNLPRGLNENYARELLELHTLGVDGGYTQQDIVEVARAFTGWTIGRPRTRDEGTFRFEPRMHDTGAKTVLGRTLKAGRGIEDGEEVLDLLARHPSTARFVSMKLARRFVADDPPAALVDRAADVFRRTDGDLREVVRTIVTSPEFFAPEARHAKVKTPFEFVVSALRVTGADVRSPLPLARTLQQLGMPLYLCQPPTGYKDTADAWVNTGALIARMNFALALANGRQRGLRVDLDALTNHAGSVEEGRAAVVAAVLRGEASETTSATIERAATMPQVVALALGAPEFQRR